MLRLFLCLVCSLAWAMGGLRAQWVSTPFGANRLQYEASGPWFRYETKNFAFTYTKETESLVQFLVPFAESDYAATRNLLEYQVRHKIEVILYRDYGLYRQTNIGLAAPWSKAGGTTQLLDQKVLLFFEGNHQLLREQLREGIARCILNRMLFGSNLQEVVQNSVLMQLPLWFTEGITAFATERWTVEQDELLRDLLLSGKYKGFFDLAEHRPRLAGQALFYFTEQTQGLSAVSNLLYLTRINREVESGFAYVFGASFYAVGGTKWWDFYSQRYNTDVEERLYPSVEPWVLRLGKGEALVGRPRLHPSGRYVAYVGARLGEYRVYLGDRERPKAKPRILFRGGTRPSGRMVVQRDFPLLAWGAGGSELLLSDWHKGRGRLTWLNPFGEGKFLLRQEGLKGLDQITSLAWGGDKTWLLTGTQAGYSNVYRYEQGQLKALTKDYWDDTEVAPAVLGGKTGLVFASNRPEARLDYPALGSGDTLLPLGQMDLFFLPYDGSGLIRLSHTPQTKETAAFALGDGRLSFISDVNGIQNRYLLRLDSLVRAYEPRYYRASTGMSEAWPFDSLSQPLPLGDSLWFEPIYQVVGQAQALSNYSRSLVYQDYSLDKNLVLDLFYRDGKPQVFIRQLRWDEPLEQNPRSTQFRLSEEKRLRLPSNQDFGINQMSLAGSVAPPQPKTQTDSPPPTPPKNLDTLSLAPPPPRIDTQKIDIDNYLFQTEFTPKDSSKTLQQQNQSQREVEPIKPIVLREGKDGRIEVLKPEPNNEPNPPNNNVPNNNPSPNPQPLNPQPPRIKALSYQAQRKTAYQQFFRLEETSLVFDNTPMFWNYDRFLGGSYRYPNLGLMLRTSFSDLFENYRLELGLRLPLNFNGAEYFMSFNNRKKRIDQRYTVYRRSRNEDYLLIDSLSGQQIQSRGRDLKYLALAEWSYPLSELQKLSLTASYQNDRIDIFARDLNTLSVAPFLTQRIGLRADYVLEAVQSLGLNLNKGHRLRTWAETFMPTQIQGPWTFNLGLDYRYYQSLDNKSILAFRLVSAQSFGGEKLLYSLGGVENWVFPATNTTIALPRGPGFLYQTAMANLRGFENNIRNGRAFVLANLELRLPLGAYLPRMANFLRQIQLIGFADAGSAWQGRSPFDLNNPLNSTLIDDNGPNSFSPIRLRVNYFRSPFVLGYGLGLRTILLGYFLRLDYGWGIETGQITRPRLHLALGTDF